MKRFGIVFVVALAILSMGTQLTFRGGGRVTSTVTGYYADDQVDTVTYSVEGVEAAARFFVQHDDSISITDVIVRRVYNGQWMAVQAGDTILGATAATAAGVQSAAVTLTPLADTWKFIVTYASSANGITDSTLTYGLVKRR